MHEVPELETDVLVVGTGPMGAATTLALATYGVRVHTVSKWNWLANSPRAHITNPRTLEVLRDLDVEQDAERYATPWDQMGDMVFAESLAGEELARARLVGRGDDRISDYLTGSPCGFLDLPQLYLEPVLASNAAARGASLAFNTEYLDHVQDDDGVTVQLRDRLTGRTYAARAKYLVGADGAKSKVIEDLGLPIQGDLGRAATAYVLFRADLARHVAHRPGIIHFLVTSSASYGELGMGMLRAVRPWHTWIAGWGFDPAQGDPDFSTDAIVDKVRGFVGDPDLRIDINATSVWYVNEAFAPRYSKGRVFCGGDAVHRHPPSSGLGSNTSIQDGFNLAWKLAYVLDGSADPQLLETYSEERAPVGEFVVRRANQSRRDYSALTEVFAGPDLRDPAGSGLARLKSPGPDGAAARDALRRAIDFKQDEFNSQGVDMNQRYTSSAVVPDPSAGPEIPDRDFEVYLNPTTRPGAKIPHVWLVDESGNRISTLDVVGKGRFTLVTGLGGHAWAAATARLDLPYLRAVVIGAAGTTDPYTAWPRISEIDEAGALLVRPDGVVALRIPHAVDDIDRAVAILEDALAQILGRSPVESSDESAKVSPQPDAATQRPDPTRSSQPTPPLHHPHENEEPVMRRIVTGTDSQGRSVVISDATPPRSVDFATIPGFSETLVWASDGEAAVDTSGDDPTESVTSYVPSAGGTRVLAMTFPPEASRENLTAAPEEIGAEFGAAMPGLAELFEPSGMHVTPTFDYVVVTRGELTLETDEGKLTTVRVGDVVVQNGTRHAWRNFTDEPTDVLVVLVAPSA